MAALAWVVPSLPGRLGERHNRLSSEVAEPELARGLADALAELLRERALIAKTVTKSHLEDRQRSLSELLRRGLDARA